MYQPPNVLEENSTTRDHMLLGRPEAKSHEDLLPCSQNGVLHVAIGARCRDCVRTLTNIAVAQYNYSRTTKFLSTTFPYRAVAKGADAMCAICWEEVSERVL